MGVVKIRELPKYTQYEITAMVKEDINAQNKELSEISSSFGIDSDIISDILVGEVIFKAPHYEAASRLLAIKVEELLSELEYNSTVYFRANNNNLEIKEFVSKMDYLFTEWVYQKKIAGDIE